MPRITVNFDTCQSFGMCCLEADHLFSMDDSSNLSYSAEIPESEREAAERAADVCPTQSITVE